MSGDVAGFGPGERRLNGEQTTGRVYRNLSEPAFGTHVPVCEASRDTIFSASRLLPLLGGV